MGERLRFRLQYKIAGPLRGAGHIAPERNFDPGQIILRRMVNIDPGNIESLRGREMIHIRLHPVGIAPPLEIKILGHELVRALVLIDERHLPG
ncbi:hypothetical protein D3C77_553310 [compost metagenome]